jgi:transaldolase
MNALQELSKAGQSFWLDNLSRDMLISGELKNRIQEQDLRGVTSNPAIFDKAITNSTLYDDQIKELALLNKSTAEIYEALIVRDVQDACDVLMPVYERTNGLDGYVSLEVSPHLARDTEGTIDEAHHLNDRVNRANLMIKIPGTAEGLPAIHKMLHAGVNINVTLLFSIKRYNAVAQTFIDALTDRLNSGKAVDRVASVASFFISRLDVLIDQLLAHRELDENRRYKGVDVSTLFGKSAIANAKYAYQQFSQAFSTPKWQKLAQQGAAVQRLLWASTGTKNPDYSDVMYVEPLIGPHTVTTLPEETCDAFIDHGTVEYTTISQDMHKASFIMDQLDKANIDIDLVCDQLLNEGIQKFIEPFDNMLGTIERKRLDFIAEQNGMIHQKW